MALESCAAARLAGQSAPETAPPAAACSTDLRIGSDRLLNAALGRFTMGLSPAALWLAYADWAIHLVASPGKCEQLAEKAARKLVRLALAIAAGTTASPSAPQGLPTPIRKPGALGWARWRAHGGPHGCRGSSVTLLTAVYHRRSALPVADILRWRLHPAAISTRSSTRTGASHRQQLREGAVIGFAGAEDGDLRNSPYDANVV